MNFINFEGEKFKVVPFSKKDNFNNKLGLKRLESNLIFFAKCSKERFHKFIIDNPLKYKYDDDKFDEQYIKKFKFFEYIIYYKMGYIVIESEIKLRQIGELGDKYYGIEESIFNFLEEISGCKKELGYATEKDYPLPFKSRVSDKKCKKIGCNVKVPDDFEYCGKHDKIRSLKYLLLNRYSSEYEWMEKIKILIY